MDEQGPDQRQEYLDNIALARPFRIKADRAALSRWYSTWGAVKNGDRTATTKKMGLAILAKRKGWIDTIDDLYRGDDVVAVLPPVVEHPPGAACAAVPDAAPPAKAPAAKKFGGKGKGGTGKGCKGNGKP